jgi:hypothetical protein
MLPRRNPRAGKCQIPVDPCVTAATMAVALRIRHQAGAPINQKVCSWFMSAHPSSHLVTALMASPVTEEGRLQDVGL